MLSSLLSVMRFFVWFVAAGIVMGLGTGTSSVLSRFIGAGDTKV